MRKIICCFLALLCVQLFCKRQKSVEEGCAEVGSNGAKMRCEGHKLLFCNSGTGYTWKATSGCAPNQTCFVAPDEKSGGCR